MPNPTALILLVLALLLIVVAYKGTQENWIAAVLGHAPADSGSSSSGSSAVPPLSDALSPAASGQAPLSNPFNPLNLPSFPGTLANPGPLTGPLDTVKRHLPPLIASLVP